MSVHVEWLNLKAVQLYTTANAARPLSRTVPLGSATQLMTRNQLECIYL
jgi:hypothetical protein